MRRRATLTAVVLGILLAPAPAAASNTDVAIVGDSVIEQSRIPVRNEVERHHQIAWFETQNSGTVLKFHPKIVAEVTPAGGPDILLIELGTGNAYWGTAFDEFRSQVRSLLEDVTPYVSCVRWFEMKPGGTAYYPGINARATTINQILRDEVNSFANARTVHYEAWTRMVGDSAFRGDGLHLNANGRRQLALLAAQAADGCDPAITSGPYWDVPDDYWAAPAIDWVAQRHLIDGYANGTYRAEVGWVRPPLERADWVRALWRREGRPGGQPPAPWPDTPPSAAAPLAWAADADVVTVPPDHRFRPAAPTSRADAVQWLYRAEGRPDASIYPDPAYPDVPPGVARALRWAAGVSVVTTPPGRPFHPQGVLTRAQAASFLFRADHVDG